MKATSHPQDQLTGGRTIARFGAARLVQTPGGRLEIRGGSGSDQVEVREWISLFMHEAVPWSVSQSTDN